jgi:hypothetical protein
MRRDGTVSGAMLLWLEARLVDRSLSVSRIYVQQLVAALGGARLHDSAWCCLRVCGSE